MWFTGSWVLLKSCNLGFENFFWTSLFRISNDRGEVIKVITIPLVACFTGLLYCSSISASLCYQSVHIHHHVFWWLFFSESHLLLGYPFSWASSTVSFYKTNEFMEEGCYLRIIFLNFFEFFLVWFDRSCSQNGKVICMDVLCLKWMAYMAMLYLDWMIYTVMFCLD